MSRMWLWFRSMIDRDNVRADPKLVQVVGPALHHFPAHGRDALLSTYEGTVTESSMSMSMLVVECVYELTRLATGNWVFTCLWLSSVGRRAHR
ncbi:hypothetical protein CKY39_10495 [Variovorax boronicumulans]|uniref:Uncharacterized protein n=1 Tax=Variovorax boronicumulans TaxID=436515 RepID=A0A250DGV4_9BURK|nr:hypothetical protein CKY39_10495 [Variovorax boronicumulans]